MYYVIYTEWESVLYHGIKTRISLVFKEKIEVKVVLIYGSSLSRYQDTVRL